MTEPREIRSDHVAEHPAFRAWARVHGSQAAPTKIEVLKQTKRKTMVCRLSGSGTEMENVITKRSFRHSLEMIISDFDRLEGQWSELLEFCDKLPLSLVHGDFKERNIRIRAAAHDRGVPILVAFDWAGLAGAYRLLTY